MIAGVAMPWGGRARVSVRGEVMQETVVRGAFRNLRPVPLVLGHGGPVIGQVTPEDTPRGLEVRGEYGSDLDGRDAFSVEMSVETETQSDDLRIVTRATLHKLAAVEAPAYDDAEIEVRQTTPRKLRRFAW